MSEHITSGLQKIVFFMLMNWDLKKTDTSVFKDLSHNKDLVPKFTENLNHIVQMFSSYYNIAYDIQGVRDSGVDILIQYENDIKKEAIGIQIKSYDDLNNKEFLSKLKAQMFEASSWNVKDLYIILCTDDSIHRDRIRNTIADIKKSDSKIHIVEPNKAINFYNLNDVDIFIHILNYYRSDELIYNNAKNGLKEFSLAESAVIIDTYCNFIHDPYRWLDTSDLFNSSLYISISNKYKNASLDFFELDEDEIQLIETIEDLDDSMVWSRIYESGFFNHSDCENIKLNPSADMSLYSFIVESRSRIQNLDEHDFKEYILKSLLSEKVEIANRFLLRD